MKMLNVTVLKRMTADSLGDLLDRLYDDIGENHEYYKLVEKVMNQKDDLYIEHQRLADERKKQRELELQLLRQKVDNMLDSAPIKKMEAIFVVYYERDYSNDYVVDEYNFIIKSLVADSVQNTDGLWQFDCIEAVHRKMRNLIYDRVYDKYVRRGTYGELVSFYDDVYTELARLGAFDE